MTILVNLNIYSFVSVIFHSFIYSPIHSSSFFFSFFVFATDIFDIAVILRTLLMLRENVVHSWRLSCSLIAHSLFNLFSRHRQAFSLLCGGLVALE